MKFQQPFGAGNSVLFITRGILSSRVVLRYPRRTNDQRLLYCVETSMDFVTWSDTRTLVVGESVLPQQNGMESVLLELSTLPADSHQFFRIKVRPPF